MRERKSEASLADKAGRERRRKLDAALFLLLSSLRFVVASPRGIDTLCFFPRMFLQASSAPALESLARRQSAARTATAPLLPTTTPHAPSRQMPARRLHMAVAVSALAEAPPRAAASSSSSSSSSSSAASSSGGGHAALLHGLGAVGDVPPKLMPFLLRLAHVK